jgi:hypothetical protein
VVQIPGVNSKAVAYLDATAQLLLTGDNIGSGTVTLMATCGYSNIVGTPEQATYAINAYTAFAQSVAALMELTKDMDQLTIVTAEAILGASYLADINTLITKFLNADHDQRYTTSAKESTATIARTGRLPMAAPVWLCMILSWDCTGIVLEVQPCILLMKTTSSLSLTTAPITPSTIRTFRPAALS